MDTEKLKKANELSKMIEMFKKQLEAWEKADDFAESALKVVQNHNGYNQELYVDVNFIDFKIMKTLAVSKLQERLRKTEKEFEKL